MVAEYDEDKVEKAVGCLKALAHPIRLKILATLQDRETNVQNLVETVGTTPPNISQHLTVMRDNNILSSRKEVNQVF